MTHRSRRWRWPTSCGFASRTSRSAGRTGSGGPFGFGIVAELLTVLPDGTVRNASLYLYDPGRREVFMGPNGIPEFVDCHGSEFELYKRADDEGYAPLAHSICFASHHARERRVGDGA